MVNGKRQQGSSSKRSSQRNRDDSQPDASEEQPVKRSRVSRACDQCRASREKCDGAQPKCGTCSAQSRSCSYNEQPKKRGIQPNYIRTLELALAWVLQTYPEVETRLTSGLPMPGDSARLLIGGTDASTTETLHTAWRESLVNKQIEQMLSGLTIDISGQSVGRSVTNASSVNVPYSSPPLSAPSDSGARRQTQQAAAESRLPGPNVALTDGNLYQLPSDAWTLLEYYFAFTHSWLPMADKSLILKTMYSYPAEGLRRQDIGTAEHAELWAIMALVSTQQHDLVSRNDMAWIRELAESLLPTGNASFELPHIRASIIISIIDMLSERMLAAWLRIGSVVRLLYLFQLLKSLGQTTRWCRHIHLVAYVLESALALHMGTPGHLTSEYITSIGFVEEDGMEEWAPWQDPLDPSHQAKAPTRSFSTLNDLVRVYMQLGDNQISTMGTPNAKSVAFDLIKNAASKSNRIQPSVLVTSRGNSLLGRPSNGDVFARSSEVPQEMSSSLNDQTAGLPDVNQNHPFMSIPNEPALYNVGTSPAMPTASTGLWDVTGAVNTAPPPVSPEARMDGSGDIFEELANLERQDSIQQPQFLRNLGFSADLDLAEFFGEDYQSSDPLLAYLHPSGYSMTHNALDASGYK